MPMGNDFEIDGRLVRALIYGKDKTKKSWWALRAAEAGYNCILLDGDDGATIVKQLPMEARKKILIVDIVNSRTRAACSLFMASFCKNKNIFMWDEQEKCSYPVNFKRNPEHSYIMFDPSKLTANDVVIIDSWTALAASTLIQFATETGMDLAEVEKEKDQFAHLNFQARFLDYVLNAIHSLPCHVIVIGHEQEWEKFKGAGKDRKIVGTYIQPISSTGPQGQKLGKHFSDVLHFSRISDIRFEINSGGDDSRAGGSRILPPQKWKWDDVTPQLLFNAVGAKSTGEPCRGAVYIPRGGSLVTEPNVVSMPQLQHVEETKIIGPAKSSVLGKLKLNAAS